MCHGPCYEFKRVYGVIVHLNIKKEKVTLMMSGDRTHVLLFELSGRDLVLITGRVSLSVVFISMYFKPDESLMQPQFEGSLFFIIN